MFRGLYFPPLSIAFTIHGRLGFFGLHFHSPHSAFVRQSTVRLMKLVIINVSCFHLFCRWHVFYDNIVFAWQHLAGIDTLNSKSITHSLSSFRYITKTMANPSNQKRHSVTPKQTAINYHQLFKDFKVYLVKNSACFLKFGILTLAALLGRGCFAKHCAFFANILFCL